MALNAKNEMRKYLLHSYSQIHFFSRAALSHILCFYASHYKWIQMTRICILWQPGTHLSKHIDSDHIAADRAYLRDQGILKGYEKIRRENDK